MNDEKTGVLLGEMANFYLSIPVAVVKEMLSKSHPEITPEELDAVLQRPADVLAEIGVLEALVIAPDGAHLPRPAVGETQHPLDPVALDHRTAGDAGAERSLSNVNLLNC